MKNEKIIRRKKYTVYWWYDELWKLNNNLVWEVNYGLLQDFFKKSYNYDYYDEKVYTARYVCIESDLGERVNVIALSSWINNPVHVGYLAHEVLHLLQESFINMGLPLSRDSDEAYCYTMECYMRKCMEVLNEKLHRV